MNDTTIKLTFDQRFLLAQIHYAVSEILERNEIPLAFPGALDSYLKIIRDDLRLLRAD